MFTTSLNYTLKMKTVHQTDYCSDEAKFANQSLRQTPQVMETMDDGKTHGEGDGNVEDDLERTGEKAKERVVWNATLVEELKAENNKNTKFAIQNSQNLSVAVRSVIFDESSKTEGNTGICSSRYT